MTTEKSINENRPEGATMRIDVEAAKRLKAKAVGMKRAAFNIQANAARLIENADDFIELMDVLITGPSEP